MSDKIKRSRCPVCGQTRPSYLIASHVTQCREGARLQRERLLTLMQLGSN